MARQTTNLNLYLADDTDTFQDYVKNSTASMNHNMELLDTNAGTVSTSLSNKVDKVSGKGLSTNDYTTTEKNKLSGIATGATLTAASSTPGDGTIKINGTDTTVYTLPSATSSTLGGVKVTLNGTTLVISTT